MLLFCFLAGFSIGRAYIPAGLALLLAAILNTLQLKQTHKTEYSQFFLTLDFLFL